MTTPTPFTKTDLLANPIQHVDITRFDARSIIDAYEQTAFQARNTARAARIYSQMLGDRDCVVILTLAGSLISAGLKKTIITLLEHNMVDAIVSSGANIVDQDFFEGLGFKHYIAPGSPESPPVDDPTLRDMAIDRIYDTYINEDELRVCDDTTKAVFDSLEPGAYSSRQLIAELGRYLDQHHPKNESVVLTAYRRGVPIFCPAFSDCSAGFGVVLHQAERAAAGKPSVSIDSGRDFYELTKIKLHTMEHGGDTGLLMLAGGVPKNFVQDIVVSAELLVEKGLAPEGETPMHKYAVQITAADVRDGALSGSTLREACSWGKVDVVYEQMVFGEVTSLFPLIASDAYHRKAWAKRPQRKLAELFEAAAV
ncbi:MAG: deoxyhypusine synthase [Phycisphaeraceae bacterium]|nr:deoxyhypusine synthase [Phycisphaeraceae bacterium]MCW5761734.1 deoxyhypusine synthase [Phycisphaeraceae bacterium]